MDNSRKIYLVVPKLIEQSTWGGDYILNAKGWKNKKSFKGIKIGQSYELFSGSKLRSDLVTSEDKKFVGELGDAMETDKIIYNGGNEKLTEIGDLIKSDPEKILGKKVLKKHGSAIKILIKFTQSKGNSFQIHVRKKDQSDKWQSKPESWFFLENGLITLGIKKNVDWNEYKKCCFLLNEYLQDLSSQIRTDKLTFKKAKTLAEAKVKLLNPWQYVNLLKTKKCDLIDLSQGGAHHSWEENEKLIPRGNIVYELCYDVMDPNSVLRSFDKGKFKPDGTLRNLNIEDYFKYIDRSKKANEAASHKAIKKLIVKSSSFAAYNLLRTKYYSVDQLLIKKKYSGKEILAKDSFVHYFVKEGAIKLTTGESKMVVTRGHSCFLPAAIKNCVLEPLDNKQCEILKTFVN